MTREFAANQRKEGIQVQRPPKVTLNKNNVPAMQKILYEVTDDIDQDAFVRSFYKPFF